MKWPVNRSSPDDKPSDLDALLARPTVETGEETRLEAEVGDGDGRGSAGPDRPVRGRLETWLRGGASEPASVGSDAEEIGELRAISIDAIVPNTYQPRRFFDEESLAELAESIRELGVLQPVLVRASGDGYELVAGERRWRAARLAGLQVIPAVIREAGNRTALEEAIVENLHREDLNPLEEAAAYLQLVDDFGLTQDGVAQRVGKSRSAVANAIRLLQLPSEVQRLVMTGALTAGHARALASLDDHGRQVELAERIVREDLSVRAAEEACRGVAGVRRSRREGGGPESEDSAASAAVLEVRARLEEQLSTKVDIQEGSAGGRLVIRFADPEDLARIFDLLSRGAGPDETATS